MEKSKIDAFVLANKEKFTPQHLGIMKERLNSLPDEKEVQVSGTSYKNPTTTLLLSLFFGYLGIDRFILGQVGLGVVKLLTCGGGGLWWIIDWFTAKRRTCEYNFNKFNTALLF